MKITPLQRESAGKIAKLLSEATNSTNNWHAVEQAKRECEVLENLMGGPALPPETHAGVHALYMVSMLIVRLYQPPDEAQE